MHPACDNPAGTVHRHNNKFHCRNFDAVSYESDNEAFRERNISVELRIINT